MRLMALVGGQANWYTIHMKKYLCLVLLSLPLTLGAQSYKGFKALAGRLENALTRSAVRFIPKRTYQLSQLLFRPMPKPSIPVLDSQIVLAAPQRQQWLTDYQKIIADFEQFKEESSSFVFYQSIPLERRKLSAEETRQWLGKILPLHGQLLAFYLTTQQDPALKYALDYVEYVIWLVDPYLVSALHLKVQPKIAPFNLQEFLLYPPQDTPLQDPSITLEGKHITIINDDRYLLDYFEHLANIGVLFPGATLHLQGEAMQFLFWLKYTVPTPPDIIFADIQLGENNGYYLAHELRKAGYKGGLIALTSYTETESYARQLKAAGFDGLVSLDDQYYSKIPFPQRLTQAAQLYLERSSK